MSEAEASEQLDTASLFAAERRSGDWFAAVRPSGHWYPARHDDKSRRTSQVVHR